MIKRNIEFTPTPEELARCWCMMDSKKQAIFFSEIGKIVRDEWEVGGIYNQLEFINQDSDLTPDGRFIMKTIGEYSDEKIETNPQD